MVALAGFMRSSITQACAPQGGSYEVARHLARLYQSLGGTIYYKSRVSDLVVEGNRATGIVLENGETRRAGHVIWAGDGRTLILEILGGRYLDERVMAMYDGWTPVKPVLHVALGVNRDLSGEPHGILLEVGKPVTVAGRDHRWLSVLHHCFDKSMAQEGKSAVEVWYDTENEY